jgi:uncharacterized protein
MNAVFADTFYFLALVNPDDIFHAEASRFNIQFAKMVTTLWILAEVGDALSAPCNRPLFLELLETLGNAPEVQVVKSSNDLFDRGVELFRKRKDKEWSLTDCISISLMDEMKISAALTGDRHFEQAGFQVLLKKGPSTKSS